MSSSDKAGHSQQAMSQQAAETAYQRASDCFRAGDFQTALSLLTEIDNAIPNRPEIVKAIAACKTKLAGGVTVGSIAFRAGQLFADTNNAWVAKLFAGQNVRTRMTSRLRELDALLQTLALPFPTSGPRWNDLVRTSLEYLPRCGQVGKDFETPLKLGESIRELYWHHKTNCIGLSSQDRVSALKNIIRVSSGLKEIMDLLEGAEDGGAMGAVGAGFRDEFRDDAENMSYLMNADPSKFVLMFRSIPGRLEQWEVTFLDRLKTIGRPVSCISVEQSEDRTTPWIENALAKKWWLF